MFDKQSLGRFGESIAVKKIIESGYKILARNFRTKFGELDIIAKDKENIVFIEVKTRRSLKYGAPEEAVSKIKLHKMELSANIYLKRYGQKPPKCRFEVVSIIVANNKYFYKQISSF
jgi:putative endonuclease